MQTKKIKIIAEIAAYFAIGTVLACAKVNGSAPFAAAYFFGAVFSEVNPFVAIGTVAFSDLFFSANALERNVSLLTIIPFVLNGIFTLKKGRSSVLSLLCVAVRTVAVALCYAPRLGVFTVISVALTISFSYIFMLSFKWLRHAKRGVSAEPFAAVLFLALSAIGLGLSAIRIYSVSIVYAVAGCAVFGATVARKDAGVYVALALGVGHAFCSMDVTLMAVFPFCSVCMGMFSKSKRIFPMLSGLMAITVFMLYFARGGFRGEILAFFLGEVVFMAVPARVVNDMRMKNDEKSLAVRYLINRHRFDLSRRMHNLKEIFAREGEILSYFKTDNKKSVIALSERVEKNLCSRCPRYASCKGKGLSQALLAIGRISVIKNKSAISELPEFFENECSQIAALVGRFHDYALEMRKDIVAIATQNKVRASLSSSLKGVQDILAKEESMIGSPIVFDVEKENRICEQLQLAGVGCYQALISVGSEILITLLVKRDTVDKEAIEKSVSEVVGRCKITKCDDSVIKGVAVVELAQKPAFNAICGVARVGKTENATGDAHAFVKLSEGKYMCALCDGMGSGERAGEISDKAITLIEDFYRAGFDHALTVKSVNKFLKVDGDESFSALDVMVFDAKEGVVDVVKMASPPSFVKKRDRTIKISSSSLPLGIVGEITPSVSTRSVDDGDCYVFVSDGVYDCFKNDELSAFINNEDARNPQRLCDKILQKAQSVQSERRDDMTVIACMVFFDNY